MSSIRVVFGIAAGLNLEIEQLDVKTAFLHGDLEEEIYMEQPEGLKGSGKENLVCRLKKSLYELKQAPRQLDITHAFGVVSRYLSNSDGYTDANIAGDLDNRKFISGYLMIFVRGAVSWQSKLQKCIALSSTEAEEICPGLILILCACIGTPFPTYLWQLSKVYGPLMSLKLGSFPLLVVSSARMAEEVVKNHDSTFSSRPLLLGSRMLSYNGLDIAFSPYSEQWRELRKISVLHLYSNRRVQSFRGTREDEVSRMIRTISKEASSSQVTNLSKTLLSLTSTLICRIAFRKRYDEEDQQRRRFHDLLQEMQAAFVGFFFSDYIPSIGWLDSLNGMRSRLERTCSKLDSFLQELINEHLNPNRPESMNGDIIDIMLQLRQEQSTSFDLTLDHINAMLMDVFSAGSDTIAATIMWAMAALMKSPEAILKKAQAEIRGAVGNKDIVNEDDIQKLPYLKAIVKETFRLYPPAPLSVPRQTLANCIINGHEIQSNSIVYTNVWANGRDPKDWENPNEFLPERFLNISVDMKGKDFQLIPFGAGRRGCPGYSLGLAMVEVGLANLLYSFDWELPSGIKKKDIDTEVLPGLTMLKKNDLLLVTKNVYAQQVSSSGI
ncbi:6,7,8-trihydroxycoumarin synthase-like [Coffea arabica]|uniref:6,7,8-trihydroxycoumarin synthase-like n=1 Tax=Coffea arabica TaxID=13443 RepID=A0A6P6T210_COFAR